MKLYQRDEIVSLAEELRQGRKVVGYTSGVFDILHRGHVDYLQRARERCDVLIVGINSDSSVKRNKGDDRPVVRAEDRAFLIGSLKAVDYTFIFDEGNNNENIRLIKPDIYFKASDYSSQSLSSAPIVESYGGRVELIPMIPGYSSSLLIHRIQGMWATTTVQDISYEKRPAVFLDRDGTINEHIEYLHLPEKFAVLPGALEGMKLFQEQGYRLVVVTNQPGIGLGYFTREDFYRLNRELLTAASKAGVSIDKIYYCPHSKADGCACRKPSTGMLERAVSELNIDRERSIVIGDMTSDILLGKRFGAKTVLVKTGRGGEDNLFEVEPDIVASSVEEAAKSLLRGLPGSE